jgi:hypothetical protein
VLSALLLPLAALAGDDAQAEAPDPSASVEVIEVRAAESLREALGTELRDLGLVHVRRRGDAVVYRSRERWKPRTVVHDDGWVEIRDHRVALDGVSLVPPFLAVRGSFAGERLRERARVTSDPRMLSALGQVPRARFLPEETAESASRQGPAGGEDGAYVASAAEVAWAIRAAAVEPGDRVLELGSEAGYRAAVLAGCSARAAAAACAGRTARCTSRPCST